MYVPVLASEIDSSDLKVVPARSGRWKASRDSQSADRRRGKTAVGQYRADFVTRISWAICAPAPSAAGPPRWLRRATLRRGRWPADAAGSGSRVACAANLRSMNQGA